MTELKRAAEAGNVEGLYGTIMTAIADGSIPLLQADATDGDVGRAAMRAEKARLLLKRRALRMRIPLAPQPMDGELDQDLTFRLSRLSFQLKKIKRSQDMKIAEGQVEQIRDFWKKRRMYMMWKVGRSLARTGVGRKGRALWCATAQADHTDWEEHLKLPGARGGCLASQPRPPPAAPEQFYFDRVLTDAEQVTEDGWFSGIRKLGLWRSWPPWSIPNELWRALVWPKDEIDEAGRGLGYRYMEGVDSYAKYWFKQLGALIHRLRRAPTQWHTAAGFTIPKNNGKHGVYGERVVAHMCAGGRFFSNTS